MSEQAALLIRWRNGDPSPTARCADRNRGALVARAYDHADRQHSFDRKSLLPDTSVLLRSGFLLSARSKPVPAASHHRSLASGLERMVKRNYTSAGHDDPAAILAANLSIPIRPFECDGAYFSRYLISPRVDGVSADRIPSIRMRRNSVLLRAAPLSRPVLGTWRLLARPHSGAPEQLRHALLNECQEPRLDALAGCFFSVCSIGCLTAVHRSDLHCSSLRSDSRVAFNSTQSDSRRFC